MLRYILITVNAVAMDIYCPAKKPAQPEYQVEREYMNFVWIGGHVTDEWPHMKVKNLLPPPTLRLHWISGMFSSVLKVLLPLRSFISSWI